MQEKKKKGVGWGEVGEECTTKNKLVAWQKEKQSLNNGENHKTGLLIARRWETT